MDHRVKEKDAIYVRTLHDYRNVRGIDAAL